MDTAVLVYFSIGVAALLLVLLSFAVSALGDVLHDVVAPMAGWVGDHLGGIGGDADHIAGGAETGHEVGFSRFINTGSMLGFISGFGFTAAFAMTAMGVGPLGAALWGLVGGGAIGAALGIVYASLRGARATTSYTMADLVGKTGFVTEVIPAGGRGVVTITVNGVSTWHTAMAPGRRDRDVPTGAQVVVRGEAGPVLYVEEVSAAKL